MSQVKEKGCEISAGKQTFGLFVLADSFAGRQNSVSSEAEKGEKKKKEVVCSK